MPEKLVELHANGHHQRVLQNSPIRVTVAGQQLVNHVFHSNKPAWNSSVDQWSVWPMMQSINQSINQSIYCSISQSIKQSRVCKHSLKCRRGSMVRRICR